MSRNGFTLLEILIVLTLIGILSAVVIPSIADRTDTFEVVEQARRINTDVSKIRARAVAEKKDYTLTLTDGKTIKIVRKDGGGAETVTKSSSLPTGASATLNGSSTGTITFYSSGRVDTTGELRIFGAQKTHMIRILASGMTRWETE